jgi:simple sugar transport system ATP-binding protein
MISHNLAHVFDLCDRISVMKTGTVVASRAMRETSREEILRYIVMGREAAA